MSDYTEEFAFSGVSDETKSFAQEGNFPPTYWIQITNEGPGTVSIVVPQAGNLWVFYEQGSAPAQQIGVWHQGGTTTPIQQGENNVTVGDGDTLYYQLANPATDSIKLGYQLT